MNLNANIVDINLKRWFLLAQKTMCAAKNAARKSAGCTKVRAVLALRVRAVARASVRAVRVADTSTKAIALQMNLGGNRLAPIEIEICQQ